MKSKQPTNQSFVLEKVIESRATLKNVKKTRNGNLLLEAEDIKNENLSYNQIRTYLLKLLFISERVIRSRELELATEEEMSADLGKQKITNIRFTIRKGGEKNQSHHLHPDIQPTPYSHGGEE